MVAATKQFYHQQDWQDNCTSMPAAALRKAYRLAGSA
jgi:hypothetical protein